MKNVFFLSWEKWNKKWKIIIKLQKIVSSRWRKKFEKFIIQQKSWINSESIRGNGTQFKSTLKSKENEIKFKWEFKMKTKDTD